MCATRWAERHDSVNVLVELMDAVTPSLEEISLWSDKDASSKADILHTEVCSPSFLITIHVVNHLFGVTSEYLQSANMSLQKALKHVECSTSSSRRQSFFR